MPDLRAAGMKHHYVPQFLLRRWTDASGRLQSFAIRHGRLVRSERTPEFTGYEPGLYAILAGVFGLPEDHIERRLFGPIDNNGAKVLEKFEAHTQITENDHIAWTFFLSSLRIRQPDTLAFLRTEGMKHLKRTLAKQDQGTLPPGAPSTEQWFDQNFPGGLEAASLTSWLPRMITHDGVAEAFSGLNWWYREFAPEAPKLLLSDQPLHWEGGLNAPGFMLQLPLAPDRVFFAARSPKTEQILDQMPVPELIRRVNRTTLASSVERIWASTRQEAQAFIEANLDAMGANKLDFASLAPWKTLTTDCNAPG